MKDGWGTKRLGELADVIAGQSPKGAFYNTSGSGTPFYQGKKEFGDKFIGSPTTWTTHVTRIAVEGDVLMSVRAPVGPVNFATEEICIGRGLAAIRARADLDRHFLFYCMLSKRDEIAGTEGAVFPSINKNQISQIEVPHPPLPEQRRIVGILDEAFDGIAVAKANAEKNLQNARALFESHLNAVFTERGKVWVEKPLGECVEGVSTGPFGSLLHKADYEIGGIPLVNPVNIEGDQIVPKDGMAVGTTTAKRLSKYALREDDIVIARRGEIGRCAVVQPEQVGWLCGTGSFLIRPSHQTDACFLAHLLRSAPYRRRLESVASRATMPSISNNDLSRLVVALPPLSAQQQACACLQQLSSETQHLESIYQRKLAALYELKKSLLDQAFSGEL
jgi:type I restriction enzyme, S subunit